MYFFSFAVVTGNSIELFASTKKTSYIATRSIHPLSFSFRILTITFLLLDISAMFRVYVLRNSNEFQSRAPKCWAANARTRMLPRALCTNSRQNRGKFHKSFADFG